MWCIVSLSFSVHVPWLHRLDEERGRHAAETADAAEKAANTYEAARRCFVRKASVSLSALYAKCPYCGVL